MNAEIDVNGIVDLEMHFIRGEKLAHAQLASATVGDGNVPHEIKFLIFERLVTLLHEAQREIGLLVVEQDQRFRFVWFKKQLLVDGLQGEIFFFPLHNEVAILCLGKFVAAASPIFNQEGITLPCVEVDFFLGLDGLAEGSIPNSFVAVA